MNKVVLSYISILLGFLRKIVTSVPGFEQDKIIFLKVMTNLPHLTEGNHPNHKVRHPRCSQ